MADDLKRLTVLLDNESFRAIKRMSFEQEKPMSDFVKAWINRGLSRKPIKEHEQIPEKKADDKPMQFKQIPGDNEPRFYLVDVSAIRCNKEMNSIDKLLVGNVINSLSDSILEVGLLRPVILEQTNVDEYVLLSGQTEYIAALKAKNKNPAKAEMINAFVVPKGRLDAAKKQIQLLTGLK